MWTVLRHGGRRRDSFRTLFSGSEAAARARYAREHERMRQGAVRLLAPDGTVILSDWAPCLRTRW